MGIEGSFLTIVLVAAFVLGIIDGLAAAADREADPLDIARPSIKRLEVEARRAADELRQLDQRNGE